MEGLDDSSRKIADLVGVIDGIAFQTDILALNSAVEARQRVGTGCGKIRRTNGHTCAPGLSARHAFGR